MGNSEPGDKRLVLEIDRATNYAGKPIRANISVMDADGSGYGHRLFGPKFAGMGGQVLKSYDLDASDRRAFRSMIDEVEGRKPEPTKDEVLEALRDASFGTDPGVSMIEAVEKLYAERGL